MKSLRTFLCITLLAVALFSSQAIACTTMIVTPGATTDGSMLVAHSDDDELGDQRLVYVPAKKQEGARTIYSDFLNYPQIGRAACRERVSAPV